MYKVYWTTPSGLTLGTEYLEMIAALNEANRLRSVGMAYVAMASENPNQVGQMGATGIESGKLPSGEEYTWSKRR